MYTKEDLKEYLKAMGLTGKETILVHSSMKSIGEVEGRADTVLDALIEYFKDGLLLLPTHTWKNINEDNPVYDPAVTPSCVQGVLLYSSPARYSLALTPIPAILCVG